MNKHYGLIVDWQYSKATYFSCQLLDLFCKADLVNQRKLAKAFPEIYDAFQYWLNGEYTKDVIKKAKGEA